MEIRLATIDEANAISALIMSVAHYFTLDPQGHGAEAFLKTIQPASIASCIASENFMYVAAFVADKLAEVAAIRDNEHLFHLFVAPKFQRQGIAERLWSFVKDAAIHSGNRHCFTVNSTPYAVPVYERFGFRATGPKVETDGIAFVPMRWDGADRQR